MFKGMGRVVKITFIVQGFYYFSLQLLSQYNTLFATSLGAGGGEIGLINSLSALVAGIVALFVGLFIESYSLKKIILFGFVCDIVAMIIFISSRNWIMLIPAFILYAQIVRQMPIADMIFISFTRTHMRATIVGFSRIFWGAIYIFAPLLAAAIVNLFGGISSEGIRPLYYISSILFTCSFLIAYKSLDDIYLHGVSKPSKNNFSLKILFSEYKGFLKGKGYLNRWILIRIFRDGFQYTLTLFISLWLVTFKNADPTILGILNSIAIFTSLIAQIPAGRLADKIGRKRTYYLFSTFFFLGIATLIYSQTFEHLILASILGIGVGGIGSAAFTPFITMFWEATETESRGRLYGLDAVLSSSSRLYASIIAGFLWDYGFNNMILIIPVLIEIFIVFPLLYTIPETLESKI
ncbi:MAG: MFS transporter [Candidatus Methanomethylicia archaeon]